MTSAVVYVDESGDLGWSFDRPYRAGGSSRYLTISALIAESDHTKYCKRVVRKLYVLHSWDPKTEKKWADMKRAERLNFADRAAKLEAARKGRISYCAITVSKENVAGHIRRDENKLYNYMIKLLLAERMAGFDNVTFVPDERAIKVKSGNSLHDYLQTVLWFELGATTNLHTIPSDSSRTLNLQFADMLAGVVQNHYEDCASDAWRSLGGSIVSQRLFFS